MSRTYRDAKGGHTSSKYGITHEPVSKFKRYCRRTARNKAKQALGKAKSRSHATRSNIFTGTDNINT